MQSELEPSGDERPATEPRMTDDAGQASFLDAVRTLVHGEPIATQRTGSDDWEPPAPEAAAATAADPATAPAHDDDWLPGRWVAEPPAYTARTRRRRATSASSRKLPRPGRRRRTVDEAAQAGVPGTEALVESTQRADATPGELEPAPEPPLPGASPRRERRRAVRLARAETKAAARAERDAARIARAELASERRTAKVDAAAARKGAKATAAALRRTTAEEARTAREAADRLAAEESEANRAAAAAARAEERAERRAADVQRRAERKAAKEQARLDRTRAKAASSVARTEAKAQARVDRARAKADARVERAERRVAGPSPEDRAAPTPSRRERRRDAALATAVTRAVVEGSATEPTTRVEPESLEEYLARVQAPLLPRRLRRSRPRTPRWFRRGAKLTVVVVLVAGAAVLPWAAPQVPDLFAGVMPGAGSEAPVVEDPPIAPPADAFTGPVGVVQQAGPYVGVRLAAAGQPREVVVRRLGVESPVLPISGQSGTLLPPDDPQELGWWREGKPVGAQFGTAVVTGHTVHNGGGALDHLGKLVRGDSVRVRTDSGWIGYTVQRTQVYSRAELAASAEEVFRLGGPGRLVLITCDDWNGEFYESNAVVFATPVHDEPFTS